MDEPRLYRSRNDVIAATPVVLPDLCVRCGAPGASRFVSDVRGRVVDRGRNRCGRGARRSGGPVPVVEVTPLAARREEIPLLADHFLSRLATTASCPFDRLHPDTAAGLVALHHSWPGNLRELEQFVRGNVSEKLRSADTTCSELARRLTSPADASG